MKSNSCQDARLPSPLTTAVHTQLRQCNNKSKRDTTQDRFFKRKMETPYYSQAHHCSMAGKNS